MGAAGILQTVKGEGKVFVIRLGSSFRQPPSPSVCLCLSFTYLSPMFFSYAFLNRIISFQVVSVK